MAHVLEVRQGDQGGDVSTSEVQLARVRKSIEALHIFSVLLLALVGAAAIATTCLRCGL